MVMNAPTKPMDKPTSSTPQPQKLTKANYYDNDQDWQTQSKSWFWKFEKCEAEALAELKGEWNPPQDLDPLLVGNYLHTHFESPEAHTEWLEEHKKAIYKYGNPKNGIKKQYEQADNMIATLESDPMFNQLYQGDKEVIVTGELFGVKWRGRIDCLNLKREQFYDLKTVDDIHKRHWSIEDHRNVSFAIDRGYDMQMAIYRELIKQTYGVECTPLIVAVSKQEQPDKGVFTIPEYLMDFQMNRIEQDQPHIQAVKDGTEKPAACGHCAYCRSQKQLQAVIDIDAIPLY